ncbi:hypothetical protein R1flu_012682 [Riccia fluitans]|uniref:Uncharacterized protein n=1 Tax=Riccia fluitans TaxID=41844 RepID=A0ABD1ZCB9_9MARC
MPYDYCFAVFVPSQPSSVTKGGTTRAEIGGATSSVVSHGNSFSPPNGMFKMVDCQKGNHIISKGTDITTRKELVYRNLKSLEEQ